MTLKTRRTTVKRMTERGCYDEATVHAILDEALLCHGFVADAQPWVISTIHARDGHTLYIHGSRGSRLLRLAEGSPLCITATLLDGIVLARSVFDHSMNYRSALVIGKGRRVIEPDEKLRA